MARRPNRYVALVLVAVLAATGCGSESPQSPPTGIDGLVIPTPSPDAADFVATIDNPWLPYTPGTVWSYTLRTGELDYLLSVTVLPDHEKVAGVATTVVETLTTPAQDGQPHGTPVRTRDYYAQDRSGNVWWLGRAGVWRAGDGAEAGLAMPANPRVGDGWRAAYGAGVVDVRQSVVTLDQSESVPAGRYSDLLGIDVTDALQPDSVRRRFFARGVGLVEEESTEGPAYLAELESVSEPATGPVTGPVTGAGATTGPSAAAPPGGPGRRGPRAPAA